MALLDGVAEGVVEHRPLAPLGRPGRRLPGQGPGAGGEREPHRRGVLQLGDRQRGAFGPAEGGGDLRAAGRLSRVAGLNAQANSACRSTLRSGAPGSLAVRAMVTVTRASATDRRETGARFGHLASA